MPRPGPSPSRAIHQLRGRRPASCSQRARRVGHAPDHLGLAELPRHAHRRADEGARDRHADRRARKRASSPTSRSRRTRRSSAPTTSAFAPRTSSRARSRSSATSTSCSTRSCVSSSSSSAPTAASSSCKARRRRAHHRARAAAATAPTRRSRFGSTILNHVMKERAAVLTHDAAMDFAASKGKSMILNRISSAIVVPLLHNNEVLGVLWLDSETLAQFQRKDLELVTAIVNQAAMFIEINILAQEDRARDRRPASASAPALAQRRRAGDLAASSRSRRAASASRECTVFNSDIRGFTRDEREARAADHRRDAQRVLRADGRDDLQVRRHARQVHGRRDHGVLGRAGGAPRRRRALSVQCALEQMEVLGEFNRTRVEDGTSSPLAVGIGIHTGPLVAGYIGSSKALSYTVIGDTANTSARLCGIASPGRSSSAKRHTRSSAPASSTRSSLRAREEQRARARGSST